MLISTDGSLEPVFDLATSHMQTETAVRTAGAGFGQAVLVADHDGRIRYANAAGSNLLGEASSSVAGKLLTDTKAHLLGLEFSRHAPQLAKRGGDAIFEVLMGEHAWLCHVVVLNDEQPSFAIFAHDVSHIHNHAKQQLTAQKELTQVLVREVRHRVKNHLQGVVGLLRQHQFSNPTASTVIDAAITQLMAISAVYGLEARLDEDRIYLCSIVNEVVSAVRVTYRAVHLHSPDLDRRAVLGETYAVPIALIVNELIVNAVKHTPVIQGAEISIALEFAPEMVRIKVFNTPASLPANLDQLNEGASGAGLNLIRSLLPIGNASLALDNHGAGVLAVLTLLPPVVRVTA